jgi:hypothetical protein
MNKIKDKEKLSSLYFFFLSAGHIYDHPALIRKKKGVNAKDWLISPFRMLRASTE